MDMTAREERNGAPSACQRKKTAYRLLAAAGLAFVLTGIALAAETISYTYDARGRVKSVTRTGTVNNNVQTSYQYDKANNRKNTTTTGSPNPPPP
jgi:YD repeat-containing protein